MFSKDENPERGSQQHERFETETDARFHLERLLAPYFLLLPEVHCRHRDGKLLRIDYLCAPKPGVQLQRPFVGIEVKRGYSSYSMFSEAIRQSHDYTEGVIEERKAPRLTGSAIPFVFLYPTISLASGSYGAWEQGTIRTSGQFNVGFVLEAHPYWSREPVVTLSLCGERWWSNVYGARNGDWKSATKVGSR